MAYYINKQDRIKRWVMVLILGGLFVTTWADNALFQAKISVSQRTEGSPKIAVVTGLEEVLLKLTSHPEVLEREIVKDKLLAHADQWLVQYNYQQDSQQNLWVHLAFDGERLIKKMQDMDIKLWPSRRPPQVLVWLFTDDTLDDNALDVLHERLEQSAKKLGLRLVFPLLDIAEQSFQSQHLQHQELAQQMLRQYSCDFLLQGDIALDPVQELWTATWQLSGSQRWHAAKKTWHHTQSNLSPLVQHTLFGLRDFLWEKVASQTSQSMQIALLVQNIQAHADYQRVLQYLRQLPMVKSVHLQSLKSNEAIYQIQLNEHVEALEHALTKSDFLLPQNYQAQSMRELLEYRLI